jgi:hypothetical protein
MRVWHVTCQYGYCLFEIGSRIRRLQTTLRMRGDSRLCKLRNHGGRP